MKSVDFTDVPQIEAHLTEMFGDGSTTLPAHLDPATQWPAKWPRQILGPVEFYEEWDKFRADPEGYEPPEPPEADGPADAGR